MGLGFKPNSAPSKAAQAPQKRGGDSKAERGFKPKKDGGMIRGPGTGTSDSIATEMDAGTFIMPADSTRTIGEDALEKVGKVPVRVSNGEFEFTPEQVQAIGAAVLAALRDATHKPVEKPAGQPKGFFGGGMIGGGLSTKSRGNGPFGEISFSQGVYVPENRLFGEEQLDWEERMQGLENRRQAFKSRNSFGGMGIGGYANGGTIQPRGFQPFANGGTVEIEEDGSPVAMGSLAPLDSNRIVGRTQIKGQGKAEYNEKYGYGPGTGRGSAPFDFRTGKKNEGYRHGFKANPTRGQGLAGGGLVRDDQLAASGMMSNDGTFIPEYQGGKNRMDMYGSTMRGRTGLANGGMVARGFHPQRFAAGGQVGMPEKAASFGFNPRSKPSTAGGAGPGLGFHPQRLNDGGQVKERGFFPYNHPDAGANVYGSTAKDIRGLVSGAGEAVANVLPSAPAPEPQATPQTATLVSVEEAQRRQAAPQRDAGPLTAAATTATTERTQMTNAQAAAANPNGRITVNRGANGRLELSGNNISGQVSYNDAQGNPLAGGGLYGKGFSGFEVAPAGSNVATGPNGSYAYATSGSGTRTPEKVQQDIAAAKQQTAARAKAMGLDVTGMDMTQASQYMAQVQAANENARASQAMSNVSGEWDRKIDLRDPQNLAKRNALVSANSFTNSPEKRAASLHEFKALVDAGANLATGEPGLNESRRQFDLSTERDYMLHAQKAYNDKARQDWRDMMDVRKLQIDQAKAVQAGLPAGYRYRNDGALEAIPGGPADVRASKEAQQQARDSNDVLDILGQARPLVKESTESYLGNALDQAARVIGVSTPGAEAGAQLKTLEGQLVSKMPKMSGPQSDKDVLLYKQMAGQIGDTSIPAKQRLAAMQTIEALHSKYASPQAQQGQQAQQRTVTRTGTLNGRSVVQYSDGTVSYTN